MTMAQALKMAEKHLKAARTYEKIELVDLSWKSALLTYNKVDDTYTLKSLVGKKFKSRPMDENEAIRLLMNDIYNVSYMGF